MSQGEQGGGFVDGVEGVREKGALPPYRYAAGDDAQGIKPHRQGIDPRRYGYRTRVGEVLRTNPVVQANCCYKEQKETNRGFQRRTKNTQAVSEAETYSRRMMRVKRLYSF